MSGHVFLSYSHKDTDIMHRVRDSLRAEGLDVWTDEGLEPGTPSWEMAVEQAIKDAGCVVVLLSPDAKKSKWVTREIALAEDDEIRVIPVLIRGDSHNAVPLRLKSHHRVDARRDLDSAIQKLIETVCKYLGVESRSAQRQRLAQEEARREREDAEGRRRQQEKESGPLNLPAWVTARLVGIVSFVAATIGLLGLLIYITSGGATPIAGSTLESPHATAEVWQPTPSETPFLTPTLRPAAIPTPTITAIPTLPPLTYILENLESPAEATPVGAPCGTLVVRVLDEWGNPVAGVQVRVAALDADWVNDERLPDYLWTDHRGEYIIPRWEYEGEIQISLVEIRGSRSLTGIPVVAPIVRNTTTCVVFTISD